MIALLTARGSRRVADIGCGTGILADRVAREVRPDVVFGVDLADGMLAQAARRSSVVQWTTAPAEQLPFEDGSLDAVVTTSAFHWFNQPAALREFHRVLTPGGVAAVATLSPGQKLPLQWLSAHRFNPSHAPNAAEMSALFGDAGFVVDGQHRVRRPVWTPISDVITVGLRP